MDKEDLKIMKIMMMMINRYKYIHIHKKYKYTTKIIFAKIKGTKEKKSQKKNNYMKHFLKTRLIRLVVNN